MLVQAKCPGCKASLSIPSEWLHQPIRCKHCGMIVQLKQPPAAAAPPRPAAPVARPAAAPVAVAKPAGVPMGIVPSAAVLARLTAAPPLAQRIPGYTIPARTSPRYRTTFAQKLVAAAVWLTVLGLLSAGGYVGVTQYMPEWDEDAGTAVASVDPSGDPAKDLNATEGPKEPPKEEKKDPPREENKPKEKTKPVESPKEKMKPVEMPKEKTKPVEKTPIRPPVTKPKETTPIRPPVRPPIRPPIRPVENPNNPNPTNPNNPNNPPRPVDPVGYGTFPRRMLAVNVSNYLYYNPVSYGPKTRDTHALLDRLSRALAIPPSQVFELSDGAPGALAKPPMKDVVTQAIKDFCATSRAQDRVIFLFSGHAIEADGEAFLVPIEGEAGDKDTLIPLKWVYEQLTGCKARQKILLLDVCRYDPSRGSERPDSGKMSEKFEEILAKPPAGVQVWTACSKDEYSLEEGLIGNSVFLNAMIEALTGGNKERRFTLPLQKPADAIPIVELSEVVDKWTTDDANYYAKVKQSPKLYGEEITEGAAAYNAGEKLADPVKIQWAEGNIFGAATKEMIQGILRETSDIPPVKIPQEGVQPIRAETFPVFAKQIMKDYESDKEDNEFRTAVKKATEVLKKHAQKFTEDFPSKNVEQLKTQVQPIQRTLAVTKLELEEALKDLQDVAKDREKEKSKRWQANYDYVLARMLERMAYVFEYQYMLSEIRTDALPELQANHIGWRLASKEKMTAKGADGKEAKDRAKKAKDILEAVAKDHKGTPYEILAKREMFTALGLEWQPMNGAGMAAPPKK